MGDVVRLHAEPPVRKKDAAAMVADDASLPKRYLIVAVDADDRRRLVEGEDNLTEAKVLERIVEMRGVLDYVPSPRIKDYLPFGYVEGKRADLIRDERILE
jgi:hypothetical protein